MELVAKNAPPEVGRPYLFQMDGGFAYSGIFVGRSGLAGVVFDCASNVHQLGPGNSFPGLARGNGRPEATFNYAGDGVLAYALRVAIPWEGELPNKRLSKDQGSDRPLDLVPGRNYLFQADGGFAYTGEFAGYAGLATAVLHKASNIHQLGPGGNFPGIARGEGRDTATINYAGDGVVLYAVRIVIPWEGALYPPR